jgi:hypothetical protein
MQVCPCQLVHYLNNSCEAPDASVFCHLLREISTVSTSLQSSLNSPQLLVQMRAGRDARTELLKLRSLCPLSASCQELGLVMDTSRSNMLRVDMLIWGFIGFSITNHLFWVTLFLKKWNTHILQHLYDLDNVPWPFAWDLSGRVGCLRPPQNLAPAAHAAQRGSTYLVMVRSPAGFAG